MKHGTVCMNVYTQTTNRGHIIKRMSDEEDLIILRGHH